MGQQAEHAEQDADLDPAGAPAEEHRSLWHKLEDLTGGRAKVVPAGDQQESNFEHIKSHHDAEDR